MTDYFALLEQPRRPWLDADELKQAFHEKTLRTHPDALTSGNGATEAFASLNEAYQTLQDPKRRIQHLLQLKGEAVARFDAVPEALAELFPAIAAATQEAERLAQKAASAASALSRSLLTADLLRSREQLAALLRTLRQLQGETDAALQCVSEMDSVMLHGLYVRYSYLQRWIAQLEEHEVRLAAG